MAVRMAADRVTGRMDLPHLGARQRRVGPAIADALEIGGDVGFRRAIAQRPAIDVEGAARAPSLHQVERAVPAAKIVVEGDEEPFAGRAPREGAGLDGAIALVGEIGEQLVEGRQLLAPQLVEIDGQIVGQIAPGERPVHLAHHLERRRLEARECVHPSAPVDPVPAAANRPSAARNRSGL